MGLFRLLLAFSVLENHLAVRAAQPDAFGLGLVYGDQAVQIFFVISGFYMALVLHEKYNRPVDYRTFIQQRFLRLYPTYLLVLVLVAALFGGIFATTSNAWGALAFYRQYGHVQSALTHGVYGLSNLAMLGQDWICFFRQDVATGQFYFGEPPAGTAAIWCPAFMFNPPAWSLAIEFTFYLLAPFLVRRSITVQVSMLVASVALRYGFLLAHTEPIHVWLTFFFPSDLGFFLAGSLGYRFYRMYRERLSIFATSQWWICCLFGALILFYRRLPNAHNFDVALIPLCAAMVPLLFAFTQNNRMDRLIGELSYPFYLFHWNVIVLTSAVMGGESPLLFEPICVAITLTCAYLTYRFFEHRLDQWRARLYLEKRA
jgi:peptidoglycan/LPS O-acetylase OafA/YrhL